MTFCVLFTAYSKDTNLSFTCEDIDVVIVTMISANHVRFATQTRNQILPKWLPYSVCVGFQNCCVALSKTKAMKSCFEELYLFLSIWGDISSSEVSTEEEES